MTDPVTGANTGQPSGSPQRADPLAGIDDALAAASSAALSDQPDHFEQIHADLQRALEITARAARP